MFPVLLQKLFGSHEPSSVQLWVSYNRQPMKAAQFMTRHPITVSPAGAGVVSSLGVNSSSLPPHRSTTSQTRRRTKCLCA